MTFFFYKVLDCKWNSGWWVERFFFLKLWIIMYIYCHFFFLFNSLSEADTVFNTLTILFCSYVTRWCQLSSLRLSDNKQVVCNFSFCRAIIGLFHIWLSFTPWLISYSEWVWKLGLMSFSQLTCSWVYQWWTFFCIILFQWAMSHRFTLIISSWSCGPSHYKSHLHSLIFSLIQLYSLTHTHTHIHTRAHIHTRTQIWI